MQYRPIGQTGIQASILSYGASPLGGVFGDVTEDTGIRTVHTALDLGINFIDVSPFYGITAAERVLGKALRGVSRDRYHLATKVGRYDWKGFDFSAQRTKRSVEESMTRLGVDHIDLIQCHDIDYVDMQPVVDETLPALHELKAEGKVGHVGITSQAFIAMRWVIDRVPPGAVETILSFGRYCLNDHALADWLPYFEERGIGVINSAPTSMGLLTPRDVPEWHSASPLMVETCRKAVALCRERGWDLTELAVQFATANPRIPTTLVGTANPDNIRKNVLAAETPIDPERLEAVLDVLEPIHNHTYHFGQPEANRDPVVDGSTTPAS